MNGTEDTAQTRPNGGPAAVEGAGRIEHIVTVVGRIVQAAFSLPLIGSLFFVWLIVNEAGCEKKPARWVPYTGWELVGKWHIELLFFPVLGLTFFVTAIVGIVRIRRKMPADYPFFCGLLKLLAANFLVLCGLFADFGVAFLEQRKYGTGLYLGFVGAVGIGVLGLIAIVRRGIARLAGKRGPPRTEVSPRRSLRLIGLFDYVLAVLLVVGAVCCVGWRLFWAKEGESWLGVLYVCVILGMSACTVVFLGRGIRCSQGWAAIAHLIGAVVVCGLNVLIMVANWTSFSALNWIVLVWGIFPLFSGAVFYVLLIRARKDINWPVRFGRCTVCGTRGVWPASKCPECGNSLRRTPDTPGLGYCIYCRESGTIGSLVCRACAHKLGKSRSAEPQNIGRNK